MSYDIPGKDRNKQLGGKFNLSNQRSIFLEKGGMQVGKMQFHEYCRPILQHLLEIISIIFTRKQEKFLRIRED